MYTQRRRQLFPSHRPRHDLQIFCDIFSYENFIWTIIFKLFCISCHAFFIILFLHQLPRRLCPFTSWSAWRGLSLLKGEIRWAESIFWTFFWNLCTLNLFRTLCVFELNLFLNLMHIWNFFWTSCTFEPFSELYIHIFKPFPESFRTSKLFEPYALFETFSKSYDPLNLSTFWTFEPSSEPFAQLNLWIFWNFEFFESLNFLNLWTFEHLNFLNL